MSQQPATFVIAGGRHYVFSDQDIKDLTKFNIAKVISGGATGADQEGEKWATERGIPIEVFPANWKKYGRKAGPLRNRQMAEHADAVILFPGGSGTRSMEKEAIDRGLPIYKLGVPF